MTTSKLRKTSSIDEGVAEFRETPNAILLDVREANEFAQGRIPNSVNVPLSAFNRVTEVAPTADIPLFVYCTAGVRSEYAAQMLANAGYLDVTDIGGIVSYTGPLA